MEDFLLFIVLIPFFIFGYYLVKRVDVFVETKEYDIEKMNDCREAKSVIISGDTPLVEIDQEIDRFRQKHEDFEIILRDGRKNDIMEND